MIAYIEKTKFIGFKSIFVNYMYMSVTKAANRVKFHS